jgi:hypothetical protein
MKNFWVVQTADGDFVCPAPICFSPFASFAEHFTEWESRHRVLESTTGARRLYVDGGFYAAENLIDSPEFYGVSA